MQEVATTQCEVKKLKAEVSDAMSGKSVVGLADMLGVSPTSMDRVVQASKTGSLTSATLDNAETPGNVRKPRFLVRVEKTLTPIVARVCASAKFKDGKTDVGGVASMLLGRLARAKSSKSRRKLDFGARPNGISPELHTLLKELAGPWREAFRNHDREASARLLQLTVKAIQGQRKGRVSEWLGPR